jgi:transcriptional regulator with XRE-family HTH domain
MDELINERLRQLRNRLGISQKEMAERLNVRQSYYSDVENSRRTVTNKFISKLENEFHVSKDWIYTGIGYMLTTDTPTHKNNQTAAFTIDGKPPKTKSEIKAEEDKLKKLIRESNKYKERLLNELGTESKKYTNLITLLKKFDNASEYLLSVKETYLNISDPESSIFGFHIPFLTNDNSIVSYEDYKKSVLEKINTLNPYTENIESITKAINGFLKELNQIDKEKIINIR